jgi:predicted lipoprotein with Yx(FWY)xxD motif
MSSITLEVFIMLGLNRKSTVAAALAVTLVSSSAMSFSEDYSYGGSPSPAAKAAPTVPAAVKFAGDFLSDSSGMTLYVFDKDAAGSGRSVCNGDCANNWPPLAASDAAKDLGDFVVVKRDDQSRQWAYKGRPLYRWAGDRKPGDSTGDGVGGVWHTAKR